ncbi:type I-C CRISPR-associated protein Cas8c/Csd1 [Elstera cyanobacteriorum]|uniref:type I-C CRISPR-associated protein Cas8c/Csd1 n=1 Tax=Elstera cyanobacteriorum TaxID=2022747 RepID=UPI0023F19FAD|nr:type I-C CRISPR-associated protein Cas8c/Csd1 [Elstera cyanobacteriorum]
MTILQSLTRAYDRLVARQEVPSFGFSNQNIGFCLSLNPDGTLVGPPHDIRLPGKKLVARVMEVPSPPKRAAGVDPCFLWDKTSYVLGVTGDEKKLKDEGKRLKAEHQAFKDYHLRALAQSDDPGLHAFVLFLQAWKPDDFNAWPDDLRLKLLDQNIVFALESERLHNVYLHDRPAAKRLWATLGSESEGASAICLVTGESAPVTRLHPSIKGVWGGQTGGGSIVSFNLDAFTSYGHEQGDNAPVSEAAAFAYTTALNKFLEKGSHNRVQIGDASTVFWAEAPEVETATLAEAMFADMFEVDEAAEAKNQIKPILDAIRKGEPLYRVAPKLAEGVKFYVLGLAPNAARISIRFWYESSFGNLTQNYQHFLADMQIDPPDPKGTPALWHYLRETAVLGKAENVPPNLAGDWMRAILTGGNYPLTLLNAILVRIRADGKINARRVAILKAMLIRTLSSKEAPVALDPKNENKGYLLGRLFALYEYIQTAAMDYKINASVKDKFYAAASAQPRKIFPLLERGSANHLSKIGKQKPGFKINLEKQVAAILELMQPDADPFPIAFSPQEQALFGLGYYHQRNEFFKKAEGTAQ